MTIAYYLVIVLHVVACLFLIGVVLLQQGKSQDLASAFGGGGTQTAFGPRGSANVLTKATTVLAGAFMVTCLALSILRPASSGGILDKVKAPAPASPKPAASGAPVSGTPASTAPAASVPAAPAPAASAPAAPASASPKPQ
jgi:preprotein translocase subunit SecG